MTRPYLLLQMNLCLSGLAGCYRQVDYPAGVVDAEARIRQTRPDAVTVNESCSGDDALIARKTGYRLRFATVIYNDKPLACIKPRNRGLFGDAVLTKSAIVSSEAQAFNVQAGPERREWLCVGTRAGIEVCTAHLASHEADEARANGPQCAELATILAQRAASRTVIFGGDLNRRSACAPQGFWIRTDSAASESPGSQQVYGSGALRFPMARLAAAAHTDHEVLLVRAQVSFRR